MRQRYRPRQFALLAAAALSLHCDSDIDDRTADEVGPEEHPALDGAPDTFAVDVPPLSTWSGWTPWTSEEYPPVTCDPGSMVAHFGCKGGWCDNVRLYCIPTGLPSSDSHWTSYFSEEGTNFSECEPGYWMSGIACKGGWCDNVSIQCTHYPSITEKDCFWTGWISEEGDGTLMFGPGFFARGAKCSGGWCDNMRFLVCRA
jgi:hypothetical protein